MQALAILSNRHPFKHSALFHSSTEFLVLGYIDTFGTRQETQGRQKDPDPKPCKCQRKPEKRQLTLRKRMPTFSIEARYSKGLARVKVLKREPEGRREMERGTCTAKSPKPSGARSGTGFPGLSVWGCVLRPRAPARSTRGGSTETSVKRDSGHPGARDLRRLTGLSP